MINSFLGLFRTSPGSSTAIKLPDLSSHKDWNSLPKQILEQILDLVGDLARIALVNRNFKEQSKCSYPALLGHYAGYPCLAELLPSELLPAQQVQAIYSRILREARSCGITTETVEPALLPLAPQRLAKIRELTLHRLEDKFHIYRAIFVRVDPLFGEAFDQMRIQSVIKLSEKDLESRQELYSSHPTELELGNRHLTHLPPHIGQLKALGNLNLRHNDLTVLPVAMKSLTKLATLFLNGNPLSPESVKDICQSLPRLQTVVIDNEQPELLEMFQTHFPQLELRIVEILRLEEPI